jgi:hypothetical protein
MGTDEMELEPKVGDQLALTAITGKELAKLIQPYLDTGWRVVNGSAMATPYIPGGSGSSHRDACFFIIIVRERLPGEEG